MADVKITCNPNPSDEGVTLYHFYQDGVQAGTNSIPELTLVSVVPGIHVYEVAAENVWGIGPKSDPVSSPKSASKCGGVNISIVITVS